MNLPVITQNGIAAISKINVIGMQIIDDKRHITSCIVDCRVCCLFIISAFNQVITKLTG